MPKPTDEELEHRFRYSKSNEEALRRHSRVTEATLELAKELRDLVPESRGLSLALTSLEEVRMWANQGIATNHDKLEQGE